MAIWSNPLQQPRKKPASFSLCSTNFKMVNSASMNMLLDALVRHQRNRGMRSRMVVPPWIKISFDIGRRILSYICLSLLVLTLGVMKTLMVSVGRLNAMDPVLGSILALLQVIGTLAQELKKRKIEESNRKQDWTKKAASMLRESDLIYDELATELGLIHPYIRKVFIQKVLPAAKAVALLTLEAMVQLIIAFSVSLLVLCIGLFSVATTILVNLPTGSDAAEERKPIWRAMKTFLDVALAEVSHRIDLADSFFKMAK